MRRPRRRWTSNDDRLVRKFNADGLTDAAIARIIDRSRELVSIHRRQLGLAARQRPSNKGWRHTPQTRQRLSQVNYARWADPSYKAKHTDRLRKQAQARIAKLPPRGTDGHKLYRKYIRVLGLEAARQEMGL